MTKANKTNETKYHNKFDGILRRIELDKIAYRVPLLGDLYVNKNGLLQRNKTEHFSRRAQKRIIVKESWNK